MSEGICSVLFIGPYGKNEEEISFREDLIYVLEKSLNISNSSNFKLEKFYEGHAGLMDQSIYKKLTESNLVIADLRGLNPNVMYEVGIRHSFNLPILLLKDDFTELPFDISHSFCLSYPLPIQASHIDELATEINNTVSRVLASKESFSSFFQSTQTRQSLKKIGTDQINIEELVTQLMDQISSLNSKSLTETEREVLNLRNEGLTQQEIADRLNKYQPQISRICQVLRARGYSV